jgi:hypothetical protein
VLPSKAAAVRFRLEAETCGVEFNEHYLRHNRNGSFTVTVFADEGKMDSRPPASPRWYRAFIARIDEALVTFS